MKSFAFFAIVFITLPTASFAQEYQGTNIRGKVVYVNSINGVQTPLQNAPVELYNFNYSTNQWTVVKFTTTDYSGFYFIYGVMPGDYYLQINKTKNYQIRVDTIDYRNCQFQDMHILYF
jgi:hypothetical protein